VPEPPAGAPEPPLETTGRGPAQFGTVHGIELSRDGLVYVADRGNRRIQIFDLSGKYRDQVFINRRGPSASSAAGLAFSTDPEQQFMYVADYGNSHVVVVDRKTLTVLYQFGARSAKPGDFQGIHNIAVDSKGNMYTAEVAPGARAQRFVFKGLGAAPAPAPAN
jgi:DNA-binding beta-propeller fold protein YncE